MRWTAASQQATDRRRRLPQAGVACFAHDVHGGLEDRPPVLVQNLPPSGEKVPGHRAALGVAARAQRGKPIGALAQLMLRQKGVQPKHHRGGESAQCASLMHASRNLRLAFGADDVLQALCGPLNLLRDVLRGRLYRLPRQGHEWKQLHKVLDAGLDVAFPRPSAHLRSACARPLVQGIPHFGARFEFLFDLTPRDPTILGRNVNGDRRLDEHSLGGSLQPETRHRISVRVPGVERSFDRNRPGLGVHNENVRMLARRSRDRARALDLHDAGRLAPPCGGAPQRSSQRLVE